MLTISLHQISIHGPHGLYPEEAIKGNDFEVDVDVQIAAVADEEWPFVDYTIINRIVQDAFGPRVYLLETLIQKIHKAIKQHFPLATRVQVCVRKLHPPMPGEIGYAQVCFADDDR